MSKMLKIFSTISVFAALVCVFALAATVFARGHKGDMRSGTVISVNAPANQLVIESNKKDNTGNITIDVTAETKIIKDGKEVTLSNIAPGDKVKIKLESDKETAKIITVTDGQKPVKN
jgi:hypothetical protein